jgi:hypothetical protein
MDLTFPWEVTGENLGSFVPLRGLTPGSVTEEHRGHEEAQRKHAYLPPLARNVNRNPSNNIRWLKEFVLIWETGAGPSLILLFLPSCLWLIQDT